MIERLFQRSLLLSLALTLAPVPLLGETNSSAPGKIEPLEPGPADGRIAFITAKMLEQLNYIRQPFDNSVSSKLLDRYLKILDPQNLHFTQSDVAEFEAYRTRLDDLTVSRRNAMSDTRPAFVIYNRFVERLQERVAYVDELLKTEQFTFAGEDRITINREELPRPKDLDEAKKLWRERLRFEYLQELLVKAGARKKAAAAQSSSSTSEESVKPENKQKSEAEEIVDTLQHRYQRNLKTFRDFDHDDVVQIYLTALAHVYDPHSDYLGPEQLESFAIGMNLSLFGIGAELRSEDGYCTINRLLAGGPALKSGKIKEKDRIIAVAQSNQPPVDVVDMNLTKAVQLIRGPKGTEVRLTIIPAGQDAGSTKIVSIVRDEIPLEDQAAKAKLIDTSSGEGQKMRLGVIDLPSFYATFDPQNNRHSEPKSTTADVRKLLVKLKKEGVEGLILDLRRNGGGSLEEAIRLTGLFIKSGPVVQVRDSDGRVEKDDDDDPSIVYDGPLIVLTSRFSASASEILAGALQDYGRALVVGDASTHGKGTVQSVNSLRPYMQMSTTNDPGALKITIKKFYRASGASTQLKGVTPDIVLPSVISESKDFGESSMDNPMPWDTIRSADYDYMNRVAPYLAELRRRSEERLAKDPEYGYVREDIALYQKQQADKTISLNLQERLKEKEESDARQKARDKERLSRPESSDTVYDIPLKLAEQEGLPAPVARTNRLDSAELKSNSAAPAGHPTISVDGEEDEKPAAVDPVMAEAQRLLLDYIKLTSSRTIAATDVSGQKTSAGEPAHGQAAQTVAP